MRSKSSKSHLGYDTSDYELIFIVDILLHDYNHLLSHKIQSVTLGN